MAELTGRALTHHGWAVQLASTGREALWAAEEWPPDAVVLDVMIPEPDGFEVCRRLRLAGCWAPVIMVTARGGVSDRVAGLDAGADDYMVKPFSFEELEARLRAVLRREPTARPTVVEVGTIRLDPATRVVTNGGVEVALTPREYALLELLMHKAGQVLTRSEILDHVWGVDSEGTSNVVDVYIGYLARQARSSVRCRPGPDRTWARLLVRCGLTWHRGPRCRSGVGSRSPPAPLPW